MSMSKHTPTPWEHGINPAYNIEGPGSISNYYVVRPAGEFPHGRWIADCGYPCDEAAANAEFIVTAVNAYEPTRELVGKLVEALGRIIDLDHHNMGPESEATRIARSALTLAREHGHGGE